MGDTDERPGIHYNIHVHGGQVNIGEIGKAKYSPGLGISKADFKALQEQIQGLEEMQQGVLKAFLESLPEAQNEADKESTGGKIIRFINEQSLPITQNLAASVLYDALKFMILG